MAVIEAKREVGPILAAERANSEAWRQEIDRNSATIFGDIDERALVWKIDFRLIPMLFILYVAALLDRVNISNALTMGLPKDLHLTDDQPNIALTIFFVPYILLEIPCNVFMKKLSPHVWISGCTFVVGISMLAQGFVKGYGGLLATRFILGLAEAGIFPGSLYLISFWYKRDESQKRFAVFTCTIVLAGAFGGLLASAIAKMDGINGLENWRWIFILEGLATMLIGVTAFFLLTDFPEDASWLSEHERDFVQYRTGYDAAPDRPLDMKDIGWFFTDPKRILGAFMYWGLVVPIYAYAYFAPTILKTLGYSVVQTQLHSVIPLAAALALCLIVGYASDYAKIRFSFAIFGIALTIAGLAILITVHHHFAVQFAALCLVAMGAFAAGVVVVCWYVMNLHGHLERSVGTAWMISFGNTGGILATFTFLKKDAPLYTRGYAICMGAICFSALSCIVYGVLILRARSRRNSGSGLTFAL